MRRGLDAGIYDAAAETLLSEKSGFQIVVITV
jgi:hypothetical protein